MSKTLEKKIEKLIELFGSLKAATILLILICIASIAGTLMPQQTANELIYSSFWFQLLLLFLLLVTFYCQLIKAPKEAGRWPGYLIHLSIPIILIGAFIGFVWGDKGQMQILEKEFSNSAIRENGTVWHIPFKVYLENFELEKYKEKVVHTLIINDEDGNRIFSGNFNNGETIKPDHLNKRVEVLKIIPNIEVDSEGNILNVSANWKNPAVKLKIDDEIVWLFANVEKLKFIKINNIEYIYSYDIKNIGIKDFKSELAIIDRDKKVLEKTVEVNHPLQYKGYTFYQAAYDTENLSWTGLLVKKDPGIPVVYFGFIVIITGLFMKLYRYTRQ